MKKNQVYVNISITDYCHKWTDCTLSIIRHGEIIVYRQLSIEQALDIGWKLVKNGATRKVASNPYNPAIHTTDITYFKQWA